MNEELRQVRDALIEELRRTDTLSVAAKSLYARFAAMSEAELAAAEEQQPGPAPDQPPAPATRRRTAADDDEEFSNSFMVRNRPAQPTIPGYREAPPPVQQTPMDLPRSMRDRRR
jgi:hypothetical protein